MKVENVTENYEKVHESYVITEDDIRSKDELNRSKRYKTNKRQCKNQLYKA